MFAWSRQRLTFCLRDLLLFRIFYNKEYMIFGFHTSYFIFPRAPSALPLPNILNRFSTISMRLYLVQLSCTNILAEQLKLYSFFVTNHEYGNAYNDNYVIRQFQSKVFDLNKNRNFVKFISSRHLVNIFLCHQYIIMKRMKRIIIYFMEIHQSKN